VEDITCTESPGSPSHLRRVLQDLPDFPTQPQGRPRGRPTAASRASRIKKNGNWTDEQLKAALAAHDDGMSMRKASDKFNIPYSSFREHLYGLRTSRVQGAKGVLTP
jgi:hypothetical protein